MPLLFIAASVALAAPLAHTGKGLPDWIAVLTSFCKDSNWPLTVASAVIAPVAACAGAVKVPCAAVAVGACPATVAAVICPAACAVGTVVVVAVGVVVPVIVGADTAVGAAATVGA